MSLPVPPLPLFFVADILFNGQPQAYARYDYGNIFLPETRTPAANR
ncbi:MAG: hypothetical protein AAF497_09995 [Planctomycetota bacterium]